MAMSKTLTGSWRAAIVLCGVLAHAVAAEAQDIWFSPNSGPGAAADYLDMFKSDASWPVVASYIKVMEIGAAGWYPADELRQMSRFLRSHHIGLETGMGPLSGTHGCGIHVEGYTAPLQSIHDAEVLKAAGVDVAYFGMDEPLWFGHRYNGAGACHSSIADIVADVADKVRQVRTVYPGAMIGDVEPIAGGLGFDWLHDIETWLDAYKAATGQPLAFFRADVAWGGPWPTIMVPLAKALKRRGIAFQVIYNSGAHTDAQWTTEALQHITEYKAVMGGLPDVVMFQCWTANPSRNLPEAAPNTLTGLALRFIQSQPK